MKESLAGILIRTGIQYDFIYPFRSLIWTLNSVVYIVVFPFIWLTVYNDQEVLFGYSREGIITYFVLLLMVEYLVMSFIDEEMNYDIREGKISNILLKPVNITQWYFYDQFGFRIMRIVLFALLYIVLTTFFHLPFFVPTHWYTIPFVLVSIIFGNLLAFQYKMILGCISFWIEEAYAIRLIVTMFTTILTGFIAPLVFLPLMVQHISVFLPFQYMLYFPLAIYLETLSIPTIIGGLSIACIWLILLWYIRSLVLQKSIRHYNAIGG
ncbi:MAG TPA: ABC-2 family transporter protein [Patescibacteria group bacterium]|nr:ABC-2 family transporter protein [Patescibacteria group bacterium]